MTEPTHPMETTRTLAKDGGSRFQWQEAAGLVGIYVILVIALATMSPYFLSVRNFLNILLAVSTIGIISVAMTMVIVSGGIDLSVGSVVALSGVAAAQLGNYQVHSGATFPLWAAVLLALLIGVAIGLFNGFAVTVLRINPLIATLGTLSIARGLAFVYSGGLSQTAPDVGWFVFLGRGQLYGAPFQVLVMAVLFILTAWVMRNTVFGRAVYAVGGSEQASRLAGIPVRRLQLWVYTLSGLSAALAGVFLCSQLGAGAPQAVTGVELSVIAAVILGGTSLSGGKGTIWGTLLGVLILGTLNNGLTLLQLSSYYQEVARGAVLLIAVGLDQLRLRLANRG